jgi:hypothetical protein
MLNNFFKLNNEDKSDKYETLEEFNKGLRTSKHLCNLSYWPDILHEIKIENTTFENFSFSKTTFNKVTFRNCTFKDCLFIGSKFVDSEIHSCIFEECNFFKATFDKVYAKPQQFKNAITNKDHANIALNLFNQLRNVYKEDSQKEYKSEAEYFFSKWRRIEDYKQSQREKVKWYKYMLKRVATAFYGFFFGFGYRLRNLLITTFGTLIGLISVNHIYSDAIFIQATEPSVIKSIYFTITTMATLGASGVPSFTETGYLIVVIDVLVGISLLTVTINSVFKKVLK